MDWKNMVMDFGQDFYGMAQQSWNKQHGWD